jgi:protoporphyrinogen oxidase
MTAARELTREGVDHWLIEKQLEVGGLATTVEDSGYRFDRTGHLLHLRSPDRRQQILGLLDEPPLEVHRQSFIYSEGVYTHYPYQSNTQGLPPAVAYACVLDFIRANTQPAASPPRNFEEYCRAHFGHAISERFMLPYNRRLWGVDPSEITTTWCDRFVPLPTLEDVLGGALGYRPRELGYNATGLYPRRGIGELSAAMRRGLTSLKLGTLPRRIDPKAHRIDFGDWSATYRTLVSTLPLPSLLRLIEDLPAPIALAGRRLRSSPLYYLDVALCRAPRKKLHWVYVPEDRFPFYRVGNYAEFSEEMAPPKAACLYVELVDREEPALERLWPSVQAGLLDLGLIQGSEDVAFCRVRRIDHAYVIYDRHRDPALEVITAYLSSVGIHSTGRYGGWNYSAMEDALDFGEQAARIALERLA